MLKLYIEPNIQPWIKYILSFIPHIISELNDCDYIISTKLEWGTINIQLIQDTLNSYIACNKKVLVFLVSDYNDPVNIPNSVLLFRTGLYRSQKKQNEYLLPFLWANSEMKNEPSFLPLIKTSIHPSVGFCGSVISHPSRIQFINRLKLAPNIKKNFILKTEYWGGNQHNDNVIKEFVNNIKSSHFTLSTRGTGNWSARFYQVLSLGRIPVIVDTDIILPFEDRINWQDLIVYCNSENDITPNIRQFWLQKDIIQAQIRCKEIYDTYLSAEKWCKIITEEILIPLKYEY
jgi:hypothetical protein